MADINDIKNIDITLNKKSAEFADAKKAIEADKSLSDFGKRKKIESIQFVYAEDRRRLADTRKSAIKEVRSRRYDSAFGVSTPSTSEAINIDKYRAELRGMNDGQLAKALKSASSVTAKLVGAELYDRGRFDPINENADKFNADALRDLQAFDESFGDQRTRPQQYMDRIMQR